MGKFGKKNIVSKNLTDYNIAILGLPGIGKTTLMKETCEKLVGEDGYIILDIGKEDGTSCINGIIAEDVETWKKFDEVTKDIIKNKATDYPNLKIVVIDTIDELFNMAEPEIIRRYNQEKMGEKGFKPVKTINAAYGGFGAGLTAVELLVLDKIWDLKKVGVAVWMCGHTKTKDIVDPVTDQTYTTISANLTQRYFNAIKTKMHIVGMAVIDRSIVTEDTGRKNVVTKEEITRNRVTAENRKIIFRDDNYGVDSKSRFAHIVEEIPMDSDAFIKALKDAIDAAREDGNSAPSVPSEKEVVKEEVKKPNFEEDLAEQLDEEELDEPEEDSEEDSEEELPFMNEPEEISYDNMSEDELRAEIRKLNKTADADVKAEVKNILKSAGVKLNDANRDTLCEIMDLFY